MSKKKPSSIGIPTPSVPTEMAKVNNLFMASLLWAAMNNCECAACQRLRKAAEIMEASMEAQV